MDPVAGASQFDRDDVPTNTTARLLLVEAGLFNGVKQISHKLSLALITSEPFEQYGGRERYKLIAQY